MSHDSLDDDLLVEECDRPPAKKMTRLRRHGEVAAASADAADAHRAQSARAPDPCDADAEAPLRKAVYLQGNLFAERKTLSRLGAVFDRARKQWYVPAGVRMSAFRAYRPADDPDGTEEDAAAPAWTAIPVHVQLDAWARAIPHLA